MWRLVAAPGHPHWYTALGEERAEGGGRSAASRGVGGRWSAAPGGVGGGYVGGEGLVCYHGGGLSARRGGHSGHPEK